MNWFKFYGQEYLVDPKMMSLTAIERALWVTMLCLASQNDGVIKHIDEYKLMILTGINIGDDEWIETPGFLDTFVSLGMITVNNDVIMLLNYNKRQEAALTNAERQARFREKHKEVTDSNDGQSYESNARVDKSRVDKKRVYTHDYLLKLPDQDLDKLTETYLCSKSQLKEKAMELYHRIQAKGQNYPDPRSFLISCLVKDFGLRQKVVRAVDYVAQKEAEFKAELEKEKGVN